MKNKIVFLTFHNWETKRQGGFHKFAESFAEKGWEVFFFSVPRPYYSYFKKDERLNKEVLLKLSKGVTYNVGKGVVHNITLPTLAIPGALRNFLPEKLVHYFEISSLKHVNRYFKNTFNNATHFVFESNEAVLYYNKIKKLFPEAKIIYRPSDPICANANAYVKLKELEKELLEKADLVLLVNKENKNTIVKNYSYLQNKQHIKILNNGVDIAAFKKEYPKPSILKKVNTLVYVGARDIDWDMVVEAASIEKKLNFIIICPEVPNQNFLAYSQKSNTNLFFINGISPKQVPSYITNADVVIVPNPKNRHKNKNWGITAKYLQAMAAKKPIIAYHDGDYLLDYEIEPVYTTQDFLTKAKQYLKTPVVNYSYNLEQRDWEYLKDEFYKLTTNL